MLTYCFAAPAVGPTGREPPAVKLSIAIRRRAGCTNHLNISGLGRRLGAPHCEFLVLRFGIGTGTPRLPLTDTWPTRPSYAIASERCMGSKPRYSLRRQRSTPQESK